MAQDPAIKTRHRLIRAAAQLFWERSYVAAGVDDLCQRAQARKGSFYHFFPAKADLAIAALEYQWALTRAEVFEPIARAGSPGLDRIRRLIDYTDAIQRQVLAEHQIVAGCPFGHLGQEMAHQDERLRGTVQTIFDGHCQFLEAWLDEAVRARQVSAGDTAARARQLLALVEGALLLSKVARDPGVFRDVCEAWPCVAGRAAPVARAIGTPPELL